MLFTRGFIRGGKFSSVRIKGGVSKASSSYPCCVLTRRDFTKIGSTKLCGGHHVCASAISRNTTHCRQLHSSSSSKQLPMFEEQIVKNSASQSPDGEFITLSPSTGPTLRFPTVWLRDNCQCSKCFNPALHSRTIDWRFFDVHVRPASVKMNGDFVDIAWSDGHLSSFDVDWLRNRSFEPEAQEKWIDETYRPARKPWNAKTFNEAFKRFNFGDIINSDEHLLSWLESLAVNGVALIEGASDSPDQSRVLAKRVAFIKKTHYGEEFIVRGKVGTSNLAYLPIHLQIHTDLPYYEYKPGLNLLHCVVQTKSKGGENQLTDCLNVANILKSEDPETYEVLTQTLVEWDDIGQDEEGRFYSLYRAPVVCLDRTGKFDRVNYSQQQRSSHFNVPLETVTSWYRAHKKFTELLHHPDNTVFFKTKPGEILTFDNVRLVHGRTGYEDAEGNERYLVGVYIDWDIAYSKIRILKKERDPGKYL